MMWGNAMGRVCVKVCLLFKAALKWEWVPQRLLCLKWTPPHPQLQRFVFSSPGKPREGEKGSDCISGRHWSIVSAVCSFSRPLTCIVVRRLVRRAETAGRTAGGWRTAGAKLEREMARGKRDSGETKTDEENKVLCTPILKWPLSSPLVGQLGIGMTHSSTQRVTKDG